MFRKPTAFLSRILKKSASFVLASFRPSTYPRGYASALHSLRPCWTAFLSILHGRFPLIPNVQAIDVLLHRNGFPAACLLLGQRFGDGTGVGQRIEGLAHRIWWQHIQVGNEVRAKVHAQLHSSGQIEGDDILKIKVTTQRDWIRWAFLRNALETATQGFKFLLNHFPIHARLLSARILLR